MNQPVAEQLAQLAKTTNIKLTAIYEVLGVTDVQYLHWRKGRFTPRRADEFYMLILVAAIGRLIENGSLVVSRRSRLRQVDATKLFTSVIGQLRVVVDIPSVG